MRLTFKNSDAALSDYITTALWASCDAEGEALDKNYTINNLDPAALSNLKTPDGLDPNGFIPIILDSVNSVIPDDLATF